MAYWSAFVKFLHFSAFRGVYFCAGCNPQLKGCLVWSYFYFWFIKAYVLISLLRGYCLAYLLLLICVRGVFVSGVETHRLRVFGFGYFSILAYVK